MAVSSKDLETLWQRYTVEIVPVGISVNQFFESNGVPYHVFEKWYKKKYQYLPYFCRNMQADGKGTAIFL